MKRRVWFVIIATLFSVTMPGLAQDRGQLSAKSLERITREVRHELLMLPWFGVFDNIAFKVDGGTVTLLGQVVRPSLKSDAENSIKHIEGVEKVDNQIEGTSTFTHGRSIAARVVSRDLRLPRA